MRVLLVNQYFRPDVAATAQLLADLAEGLASDGWDVTVVTGRARYSPLETTPSLPQRERCNGVEVFRVWSTAFGRSSMLCRLVDYFTFLVSATWKTLWMNRCDVVVCLSTPPFVALVGVVSRWRGGRFVYKVEDLYPDVAVALGKLRRGSWVQRLLAAFSRFLLSKADRVVALDDAMARVLRRRGAPRVSVIPNWSDGGAIRPEPAAGEIMRRSLGWEDSFVVLYSGNMGMAHRFDAVLESAVRLRCLLPELLFAFVGGGARRPEVEAAAARLPNVRVYDYQPRHRLHGLYNAANIHLVSLRDEVAGLLVPSKYAAALSAGKPVLLVGGKGSDLHQEIRRQGLGWVCAHEASQVVEALVEAVEAPPASVEATTRRARRVFEDSYSRIEACRRWGELLTDVAGGSVGVSADDRAAEGHDTDS